MNVSDRIRAVRKSNGLTMEAFGKRLHVSKNAISMVESGKNSASERMVADICREFKVDEDWLRFGVGSMREDIPLEQELADFLASIVRYGDDSFRARFISALSKLGEPEWDALEKIAETMAAQNKKRGKD